MVRARPVSTATRRRRRPANADDGAGAVAVADPTQDGDLDGRSYPNEAAVPLPDRQVDIADLTAMSFDDLIQLAPAVGLNGMLRWTNLLAMPCSRGCGRRPRSGTCWLHPACWR